MTGTKTDPHRFGPHPDDIVSGSATISQASGSGEGQAVTLIAAQGTGVRTYLTGFSFSNTSAEAVAVTLSDGTDEYVFQVPAGGGNNPQMVLKGAANAAWTATPSREVDNVYVNVSGFVAVDPNA